MMRTYRAECEVWVKPLFRKSRPKTQTTTWVANNYEQFLCLLREHYQGKRWTLRAWSEEIAGVKDE
jgi:hypothetical protein